MNNLIILIATSITIGLATTSLIKSTITDLIMPLLFLIFVKGTKKISGGASSFFQRVLVNKDMHFATFITEVITWFLIVMVALLISKYMNRIPFMEKFQAPVEEETRPDFMIPSQYNIAV